MSVLIILILVSLTVATGFLVAFFWAVKTGQFEDDYTPSVRMLFDSNKEQTSKSPLEPDLKVDRVGFPPNEK